MKLYRLTSNFLLRDIYELAPGPVDYEHYEHLEARQYEVSIIHKEEQKYIYKSLLLLLGLFLICMIKLKVECRWLKKKFINVLEYHIKEEIDKFDKDIKEFMTFIKDTQENKFSHQSLSNGIKDYKEIHENINFQFCIKKTMLGNSKNLFTESTINTYKISNYTWLIDSQDYLYELIENYDINIYIFNIFFLLIIMYKFVKVLSIFTISIVREGKLSYYSNSVHRILLITHHIKNMLSQQHKINNNNFFVNKFLKLNFGLQYYFFYNVLHFLIPLKNRNKFKIFLYTKLFQKFTIPVSMLSIIKSTDISGINKNSYNKYDIILQNKLMKYRSKKFTSPTSEPYYVKKSDMTGCNPFEDRHLDWAFMYRYPTMATRYRREPRPDWTDCVFKGNPLYETAWVPGPDIDPLYIDFMRDLMQQGSYDSRRLHPKAISIPDFGHETSIMGFTNKDVGAYPQYLGSVPEWHAELPNVNKYYLITSPRIDFPASWYSDPLDGSSYIYLKAYRLYEPIIDFLTILITFPEFFLFPISVMAWIFLKFTVISNDDLKVSKVGYASFFFNKNIKINNSRSLLSSTNNQVKNNLFMWLSLFTIVLFALMKFTDFFYRDIYIQGFFSNALVANNYTYSIKFFLLFLFLGVFLIHDTIFSTKVIIETYNLLLLFSIFPVLLLLVSLNNFFFFYVALEFISLLTYILLFLNKTTNAFEAGIKYFTSGGLISGAFILFGISNLWNIFGSVDIVDIASILGCQKEITSLMVFSFIFIIVGFLFKLAAFPMQQWAPSIYSGIPYSQLGFIMVLFKFILLVVFLRFYITLQPAFFFFISPVTYGIAIGSMCAGLIGIIYSAHNLSIKKFIAYSSITHVGYIFAIIVDTTNEDALWLGLYYSVFYSISILLFFIILSRFLTINKWNDDFSFKEVETFVDLQKFYNSLQYTNQVSNFYKFEFFLLVVSVWSMAGLPPLPGFFGKISILFSLFRSIQWWVYTKWAVVGRMPRHLLDQIFLKEYLVDIMIYFFLFLIFCIIVTSILMVWYYFKFFKYLFLEIPEKDEGEFYDILVPQVYQIGQSKITIETWCQTKVPVIIWNWFLIFYTFWLFIVIFFLSWNALTINLDGMTSNWAFHWIYPLVSTTEISVFDIIINDLRVWNLSPYNEARSSEALIDESKPPLDRVMLSWEESHIKKRMLEVHIPNGMNKYHVRARKYYSY